MSYDAERRDPPEERALRAEFERQHAGRNLTRHVLRGTYLSVQIAALWNQHKRTAEWMRATAFNEAAAPTDAKQDGPLIDEGTKTDAGVRDKALSEFTEYVTKNYPPDTVIADPAWHAPRLFRAAEFALKSSPQAPKTEGGGDV